MQLWWKILKRDFVNLITNKAWLVMNLFFPFGVYLLLGYLGNSQYNLNQYSAYNYFSVTALIFTALNSAGMAANAFLEERIKRPNLRVGYTGASKAAFLAAKILATTLFTSLMMGILMIAMLVVGQAKFIGIMGYLYVVCISLTASTLGICITTFVKSEEATNMVVSTAVSLFAFAGGSFFSLSYLGKIGTIITKLSFVSYLNNGLFQLIYDQTSNLLLVTGSIALVVDRKSVV